MKNVCKIIFLFSIAFILSLAPDILLAQNNGRVAIPNNPVTPVTDCYDKQVEIIFDNVITNADLTDSLSDYTNELNLTGDPIFGTIIDLKFEVHNIPSTAYQIKLNFSMVLTGQLPSSYIYLNYPNTILINESDVWNIEPFSNADGYINGFYITNPNVDCPLPIDECLGGISSVLPVGSSEPSIIQSNCDYEIKTNSTGSKLIDKNGNQCFLSSINAFFGENCITDPTLTPRESLDKHLELSDITIAPNPANSFLNIEHNGSKIELLTLFSLEGRIVKSQKVSNHSTSTQFMLDHISPGFYLLKIQNQSIEKTIKLIIQ